MMARPAQRRPALSSSPTQSLTPLSPVCAEPKSENTTITLTEDGLVETNYDEGACAAPAPFPAPRLQNWSLSRPAKKNAARDVAGGRRGQRTYYLASARDALARSCASRGLTLALLLLLLLCCPCSDREL